MTNYEKYRESCLKAQRKYDNKPETKIKRKEYEKKRYKNLKLANERIKEYKEVLDKIKEKVNQYELIKGYYDYIEENGYAETTSHDTLKEDILELLEEIE